MASMISSCVCEYMGPFKNELTVVTGYSEKQISQILENFLQEKLPESVIENSGICQNCFIKFNEYDEHQTMAQQIQKELLGMYFQTPTAYTTYNIKEVKIEKEEILYEEIENVSGTIVEEIEVDFPEYSKKYVPKKKTPKVENKTNKSSSVLVQPRKTSYSRKEKDKDEGLIVIMVNGMKRYQCEFCGKKEFNSRSRLKTHRLIHTSERNFMCQTCGASFKTLNCLKNHSRLHNNIFYYCDLCPSRFKGKHELRCHMDAIHLGRKDHICQICGKAFSRDKTLRQHLMYHLNERNIVCEVCGFKTVNRPKMARHMKSHTGERNYECSICGKRFLYSYNVTAHIKHVHYHEKRPTTNEEKLTCTVCGKIQKKIHTMYFQAQKACTDYSFEDGTSIETEEKENIGDAIVEIEVELPEKIKNYKPSYSRKEKDKDKGLIVIMVDGMKRYQCEICGKNIFKARKNLARHKLIHTSERNFICKLCGASFKTSKNLRSHTKRHENIFYYCNLCPFRSKGKHELRCHMDAIHLMRKDHICQICGKAFSRDNTLRQHVKYHKNERNIVCDVCGFKTAYSLENCFICCGFMGSFKNELTESTGFSEKTIYQLIENFTNINLSQEIIDEAGICQNCLIKFNEYDEHRSVAEQIQAELSSLFQNTCEAYGNNIKQEKQDTWEDQFHAQEEINNSIDTYEASQISNEYIAEMCMESAEEGSYPKNEKIMTTLGDNESKLVPFLKEKSSTFEKINKKVHQLEKRDYICQICEKAFLESKTLRRHMKYHLIERNICELCGFKT
ncbi:CLUMA_CG011707, isoform B [Clunio marinus]|nr:CLUMA_CG011707, isoform B [Clunio marinus]